MQTEAAPAARRLEEAAHYGPSPLSRFGARLGRQLTGGLVTVGNCSFERQAATNLLELMPSAPGSASEPHGGRCMHRFTDIESALSACAATSRCGGVSRDNGLLCSVRRGHSARWLHKFELRAGTPQRKERSISFVCTQRDRPLLPLRRPHTSTERGVAFIVMGSCADGGYSCKLIEEARRRPPPCACCFPVLTSSLYLPFPCACSFHGLASLVCLPSSVCLLLLYHVPALPLFSPPPMIASLWLCSAGPLDLCTLTQVKLAVSALRQVHKGRSDRPIAVLADGGISLQWIFDHIQPDIVQPLTFSDILDNDPRAKKLLAYPQTPFTQATARGVVRLYQRVCTTSHSLPLFALAPPFSPSLSRCCRTLAPPSGN